MILLDEDGMITIVFSIETFHLVQRMDKTKYRAETVIVGKIQL